MSTEPSAYDVVARQERARALVVEGEVPARVAGRVHRAQAYGRVAREVDTVAFLDKAVDADSAFQLFRGQAMRGDAHVPAELFAEALTASDVIGVMVRQDDLAQTSVRGEKLSDELGERVLLVLVGRAGVDDDEVAGADDVAVGRRRGRLGRGAQRHADEAGQELYPADGLAPRLGDGEEALGQVFAQPPGERADGVDDGRRGHQLGAPPAPVSMGARAPSRPRRTLR